MVLIMNELQNYRQKESFNSLNSVKSKINREKKLFRDEIRNVFY